MPIDLIYSITMLKIASARSNYALGRIDKEILKGIEESGGEILSGRLDDQFPLSTWQTGSGTQTNMNVNEVITNLAVKKYEHLKGQIHPNDHVNLGQSSNDMYNLYQRRFPSAINIATVLKTEQLLLPSIKQLILSVDEFIQKNGDVVKIGRTHLQDATPLTVGQEFSGYKTQLGNCVKRIIRSNNELRCLAIGGTAVGTGLNSYKGFDIDVCENLKKMGIEGFKPADNKFEALSSHDQMVEFSGSLTSLAVALTKIANDIRLLGSGPLCGISELRLPENEPGSSIMPGKYAV